MMHLTCISSGPSYLPCERRRLPQKTTSRADRVALHFRRVAAVESRPRRECPAPKASNEANQPSCVLGSRPGSYLQKNGYKYDIFRVCTYTCFLHRVRLPCSKIRRVSRVQVVEWVLLPTLSPEKGLEVIRTRILSTL